MSRKVIQWTVDYWWSQFCLTHFHSNSCKFWRDQKWLQWSLANLAIFFHKFLTGSSCCALLGPCLLPRKLMTCENMFECTMMSCKSATCTSQLPSANVMAIDSHPPPTSLIGQVNLFQLSNQLSLKTPRAIAASSHASAHGKATRSLRIRPASSGRGSYPAQTVPERLRETALSLSLSLSLSLWAYHVRWHTAMLPNLISIAKYRNVVETITNDPNLMVYTTHLWWNWDSLLLFDLISALLCSNSLI